MTGGKPRELCAHVRRLLLALDLQGGDPVEAARRVELSCGGAMAISYLRVRQLLADLGEDIDQPTPNWACPHHRTEQCGDCRAHEKTVRYAERYSMGPRRLRQLRSLWPAGRS